MSPGLWRQSPRCVLHCTAVLHGTSVCPPFPSQNSSTEPKSAQRSAAKPSKITYRGWQTILFFLILGMSWTASTKLCRETEKHCTVKCYLFWVSYLNWCDCNVLSFVPVLVCRWLWCCKWYFARQISGSFSQYKKKSINKSINQSTVTLNWIHAAQQQENRIVLPCDGSFSVSGWWKCGDMTRHPLTSDNHLEHGTARKKLPSVHFFRSVHQTLLLLFQQWDWPIFTLSAAAFKTQKSSQDFFFFFF